LVAIVTTVAVLSGLTGFLALLLILAESVVANYGECTIEINKKKKLEVIGGSSLLSLLDEHGIYLASACGGRGSCGYCKCTVLDGGGPVLPTEKPFLSIEEQEADVRLACQIKVKNDIFIKIPEEIFNIQQYKATVQKIIDLTYDIKELHLKLFEPPEINFKAGQYVQLQTPAYEKSRQPVSRAYSISSSPEHNDHIELIIRRVPDGICTTYVFDYLREGDSIEFTGPFGDFYIRETEADMIFVAGGSGKAPIKAMVELLHSQNSRRRMAYLFGARTKKDLYYTELFDEFQKKMQNFTFVPILSNPEEDSEWKGKTGFIPAYLNDYIKDPEKTEAYLCGSPGMIAAVEKKLLELNIPKDKIYYDSFA
jgi:Na+-transporting NADH:ubiquinone oxidoreductase subunit F